MREVKKLTADDTDRLNQLIDSGIKCRTVVFQGPIQSYNVDPHAGEPETALYSPGSGRDPKRSRLAELYYTPHGLVVIQKEGKTLVPLANVKFARIE